jgi:hypothetical protein
MLRTNDTVTALIAGLTPENREMPTPCDEWTVHDLIGHMCGGAHMIAGALQGEAPPDEAPDFLADFAYQAWLPLVPAEGRTGDGFKAAVPVADDAGALERLIAYTGRSYG